MTLSSDSRNSFFAVAKRIGRASLFCCGRSTRHYVTRRFRCNAKNTWVFNVCLAKSPV